MGNCNNGSCNHGHHGNDEDSKKIYLTLEDDSQLECDVLDIFEIKQNKYIAVLPVGTETALLYGFTENNEDISLSNIETDAEYAIASEVFMANNANNHHN